MKYMVNVRKYKKIGFILLFALIIAQIPSYIVDATEKIIISSGSCGDDAIYTLTEETEDEYTLRIDGTGAISDYYNSSYGYTSLEKVPWWAYRKKIKRVAVKKGITRIGASNFLGLGVMGVKEIELPETLKEIGDYAFYEGLNQEQFIIPEGVEKIGKLAFACSGNEWLENKTGMSTGYIKSVILPSTLKYLGEGAFQECQKLEDVTFLGDTEISSGAFLRCKSLYEVNMNGNVTRSEDANPEFEGCTSLQNIHLSDTYSWENAKIYNPHDSFEYSALKNITVNESHQYYKSVNGILYTKDQKELVYCPQENEIKEYEIPYGVEKIRTDAFGGQKNLEYVCMPNTVTEIEFGAFSNTDSLKYAVISNAVTSIPGLVFDNNDTLSVYVPDSVTETSYQGKTNWDSFGNASGEAYLLSLYGDENSYIAENYPSAFKKAIYADFIDEGKVIKTKVLFPNYKYGTLPEVENKDKEFLGWYTEETGGKLILPTDLFTGEKSIKLYAHWGRNSKYNYTIDSPTYDFSNSNWGFGYAFNYKIPYSSYKIIYGDTVKARYFYNNAGIWGGSCYGMSSTSGMFNSPNSGLDVKQFNIAVSKVYELKTSDKDSANMTITELIEAMQVSQYDTPIQKAYNTTTNDIKGLYEQVYSVKDTGKTVLIAVFGPQGGHALLGYDVEKINEKEMYLYVYDCNFPYQKRHITLSTDINGKIIGWYYHLNDMWHWGSRYEDCEISYVTYDNYYSEWKNRVMNKNNNILFLNSKDVAIYDSRNNLVATLQKGKLYTKNEDIYIVDRVGINADSNQSKQDTAMIYLPLDKYTVKNNYNNNTDIFQASMVGVDRGATVSTTSNEITFDVDDINKTNNVSINTCNGDAYNIILDSTTEIDNKQVKVSGIGYGNAVSVSQIEGKLALNNCENASVSINGKDMTASDNEIPTVQPNVTSQVSPTVKPDITTNPNQENGSSVTVKPTDTEQPNMSLDPMVTPIPTTMPQPSAEPDSTPKADNNNKPAKNLKKGAMVSDSKTQAVYKITGTGRNKTVEYVRSTKKNASKITVPAKVKLRGHTYKVTSIAKNALKNNKKLVYVVIGKNVKKIGQKAFYGCKKLRYIYVKSKKLTAKNIGKQAFGRGYRSPRVKSAKSVWRRYAHILPAKGLSKKALFIINPVKLVQ